MGVLDDAIREHLELKRRHGADPSEVQRQEHEALGPARRGPEPVDVPPGREPEPGQEPGDPVRIGPEAAAAVARRRDREPEPDREPGAGRPARRERDPEAGEPERSEAVRQREDEPELDWEEPRREPERERPRRGVSQPTGAFDAPEGKETPRRPPGAPAAGQPRPARRGGPRGAPGVPQG